MGNKKQPEIRFPEFLGSWKERSLGSILIDVSRKLNMENDVVYQLVTVKRRNGGVVSRGYYKGSEVLVKSQFTIKKGDFLISKRQVVHGATGIVPDYLDESIVSNEYLVLHGTEDLNIEFFSLISELPSMYRKFLLSSYGVDIEKLLFDVKDWKKREISIPSILEQDKITSFIKGMNKSIALHQQELTNLKQTKQGFLQKMFPKEGKSKPEIRFPGFKDLWKTKRLGDVFDVMTDYVSNGSFESLRKNVNTFNTENFAYMIRLQDASNKWKGPWLYTDEIGYNFLRKTALNPSDIIMSNVGSVGKFFLIPSLDRPMTLAPNSILLRSSKNDNYFIYHLMFNGVIINRVKEKTTPGVQPKINKTDFKKIQVLLPSIEEQIQIGNFFNQLDETIALHQQELEALQQTKKAFLQKMFV